MPVPCRKCLLSEIDPDKVYKEIVDYINSLDAEVKVNDETYQSRLSFCRECDNLRDGMCVLCGCFVEVRAIKKISNCPSNQKLW